MTSEKTNTCLKCGGKIVPFASPAMFENKKQEAVKQDGIGGLFNKGLAKYGELSQNLAKNIQGAMGMEGVVNMFKCSKCGFIELYTKN